MQANKKFKSGPENGIAPENKQAHTLNKIPETKKAFELCNLT